jgi:hypothetical protein
MKKLGCARRGCHEPFESKGGKGRKNIYHTKCKNIVDKIRSIKYYQANRGNRKIGNIPSGTVTPAAVNAYFRYEERILNAWDQKKLNSLFKYEEYVSPVLMS